MTSFSLETINYPRLGVIFLKYEPQQNKGSSADHRAGSNCSIFFSLVSLFKIDMDEIEERLILKCNSSIMQVEGTMGTPYKGGLDLGKRILDPRGTYMCGDAKENSSLQVYYRSMCPLNPLSWNGWGLWM